MGIKNTENRKMLLREKNQLKPSRGTHGSPVPQMMGALGAGNICMQPSHFRSFKKPLILALLFCFKTKVRIINSLKSFKTLTLLIRDPSEYPEEHENGQGAVSFLKAP